ncbi:MAG TPA: ATP-binding protein [Myxococcales bacterium]|jgi:two-component system NtrC family sensor kinase|nr:ATP-binding protein [Myxococcales bacterium]
MRLSIATKVFLGFLAVLICGAAVSLYGVARLRRIGEGLSLLSRPYMPLTRAVSNLEAFQKERERSTDRLLDEANPQTRAGLIALDRTYFARVVGERLAYAQQLVASAQQTATDRDALDRIAGRLAAVGARVADEEKASAALTAQLEKLPGPASDDPALTDPIARLRTAQRRVDHEVRALSQALQDQMNQGVEEAEKQERAARWAVLGLSAFALLVGLLITWLAQRALRPIRTLTEAAQRLGRGSPESVAVPEEGGDELAVLAREFNAMAQRLAARERELRAQGEALVRSERLAAIGRIAAQITHEIRNPLSSISLNAEELGERAPQARELCDAIVREVDRLAAITEEYLRFARLPKPQLQRADLNETIGDLLDFVRPELDAGGVQLSLSLSPLLPRVHADVAQLRQLLLNLVRNAREAMPQGGSLRVVTRGGEGCVEVEVRDTGPGIPRERMARIFDPFFTTKERGTGLGLAMAQEIAQEHGGQLRCESAPGAGTSFTLRLPVAALHEQASAQAIATA